MKALLGACLFILIIASATAQTLMPDQTRYVAPDDSRKFDAPEYTTPASLEDRIKLAETWPKINDISFDRKKNFTIQAGNGITIRQLINGLNLTCNFSDLNVSDINLNDVNVFLKLNQSIPQTVSGGRPNFLSGIEMDISSITGDGGGNQLFLSDPVNSGISMTTPDDIQLISNKTTSTGNIEPAGESPITIGVNTNRWTNLFSTHTNTSGTNTLGIKALQTRDYSWDADAYALEIDLSAIDSEFRLKNVAGYTMQLTSAAAASNKIQNFQNASGDIYVVTGKDVIVSDGGTGVSSFTANGVVISGATTTTALASVAPATTGTFIRANTMGVPPVQWSTLILPNAATNGQVSYATALNTLGASTKLVFDGTKLTSLDMNANRYYVNGTQGFNGTTTYLKSALVTCYADYNSGILMQIRGAGCP